MNKLNNIIAAWDYSEALMKEISHDIDRLSTYTHNLSEELSNIEAKLDHAREQWLSVITLEKQLLDFRETVLKKTISIELKKLENNPGNFSDEIDMIEKEFERLKELWIENPYPIAEEITKLKNFWVITKIKNMIENARLEDDLSTYSIEMIYNEVFKAKELWIDVSELENILLDF